MTELKIEYLPVTALKPYERNAKKHPPEQVEQIANSIREFGFRQPMVIDKDGVLVIGHGRLLAAKKLGLDAVPCVRADDLTEDQIKALRLVDNKTNESAWDFDILPEELVSIIDIDMTSFGFDVVDRAEVVEDDFEPEIPEEPASKLGQIYQLGRHRLMCGDSTSADDVLKLVDDVKIDMLLTDPPYNLNLGNCSKDEARKRHMRLDGLVIANDHMENDEFHEFLKKAFLNARASLRPGGVFHVWHAERESVNFRTALAEAGMPTHQMLVWVKSAPSFGRQDFQRQYEGVLTGEIYDVDDDEDPSSGYGTALYGWKDGAAHSWYKDRKQRDVLFFDKPKASREHPTMKPVLLFDYEMRCNTKPGSKVLDLFGGSGTTIIAAEQNGRTAFVMEYDPKFVDVIIDRWEKFTGEKAVKVNV